MSETCSLSSGRNPTPDEENEFFASYGPTTGDPFALTSYRYERRIEDLGDNGHRDVHDDRLSEKERAVTAAATASLTPPAATSKRWSDGRG